MFKTFQNLRFCSSFKKVALKADLLGTILSHAIFCSARCLRQAKIVHNSHHVILCVATIVLGFLNMFQKATTFFVLHETVVSKLYG